MRIYNIFKKSTDYTFFIFIIIVIKLLYIRIKIIINKFKYDFSIIIMFILRIFNLYTLLIIIRLINKFVNRESIEIIKVAFNTSFIKRFYYYERRD